MSVRVRSSQLPGRPEHNAFVKYKLRSGRERAQIKRWWNSGGNHKNYIDCSAVELKGAGDCVYTLVWPHSYDTHLDVEWVAKFGTLKFTKFHRATRAALLCSDGTVLSHWKFGTRPGQKPTQIDVNDSCSDGCTPGGGGTPPPPPECTVDSDCPPGQVCVDGKCVDPGGGGPDPEMCWNIPKLPTIDSSEPVAPKSTELFKVCTDIPNLPDLQ